VTTDPIRMHVRVHGVVQGVYYRASTVKQAHALGINGWVRNMQDGGVEAVFEGDADAVRRMVTWAGSGPPRAAVERIEAVEETPQGESGFRVAY